MNLCAGHAKGVKLGANRPDSESRLWDAVMGLLSLSLFPYQRKEGLDKMTVKPYQCCAPNPQ